MKKKRSDRDAILEGASAVAGAATADAFVANLSESTRRVFIDTRELVKVID